MNIETLIQSTVPLNNSKKILLNLMYTQHVVNDKFGELLKPFDLSSEQYNVLRILRGQKQNPINMCNIQERMIAKNSNTTRLIDKLLLKKLVTRNVCKVNRRKIEIKITDLGLELLTDLDPKVIQLEQMFSQKLSTTEQQQLIALLEKYRTLNPQFIFK